jgi:hypothetical protein
MAPPRGGYAYRARKRYARSHFFDFAALPYAANVPFSEADSRMADPVTTTISVLALTISSATAWLTLLRRGAVKMTQPTVIFFGPDKARGRRIPEPPKVFLRTLLFSSSKRGRVIESMHVTLARNEASQTFNVWVYGDEKLVRGSGLFVGETGVAANHHFLTPPDGSLFHFIEGTYRLDVFAKLLGDSKPTKLLSQQLDVSRDVAVALREPQAGLYFDWGPDSGRYLPHVEKRDPEPGPEDFMKFLELGQGERVAP